VRVKPHSVLIPRRWHPRAVTQSFVEKAAEGRVISGPFRGMKTAADREYFITPMLLGTFELELHPLVESLCAKDQKSIVNVGAGEGYYAVGMALRCPAARVVAFDLNARCRELTRELARNNYVSERVSAEGYCDVTALRRTLQKVPGGLIFMDVEGYENTLLQPAAVPELRACEVVVELHEHIRRGLYRQLSSRFAASHVIRRIWNRPRNYGDLPLTFSISSIFLRRWLVRSMDEFRRCTRTSWLYLSPIPTP